MTPPQKVFAGIFWRFDGDVIKEVPFQKNIPHIEES
jgi:hypothetical protein